MKDTRWALYLLEGGLGSAMHMEGWEDGRFVADLAEATRLANQVATRHRRPVTIAVFRFHPPADPTRLAELLNDLPSHGAVRKIPNVTRAVVTTVTPEMAAA